MSVGLSLRFRTCMKPLGPQQIDAIEKAEAPPPEGSTAKKQCWVFLRGSRAEYSSTGASRASMSSTSLCANAFSEPSAEIPSDSRRSMAGSCVRECIALLFLRRVVQEVETCTSARSFLTTST